MNRAETLRKKEDFDRLRHKGKSVTGKYAVLAYIPNGLENTRKAFLASKKIGNSIKRHRSARLLRESLRLIAKEYDIPNGLDILLIARAPILDSKCADVKKDIEAAMKKAKLI